MITSFMKQFTFIEAIRYTIFEIMQEVSIGFLKKIENYFFIFINNSNCKRKERNVFAADNTDRKQHIETT